MCTPSTPHASWIEPRTGFPHRWSDNLVWQRGNELFYSVCEIWMKWTGHAVLEECLVISIARRPLIFCCFLVTLKCLPLNRYPGKVFWCTQQRTGWDDSHVWVPLSTSGSGLTGNIYSFWATINQNIILVNIFSSKTVEYANDHEASHSFFLGVQSRLFTSMLLGNGNPLNIKCSLFNVLLL